MENHYWIKLTRDGYIAEIKRDIDLHYTKADDTLYKTQYYTGVFEGKDWQEAVEKAKQAYLSYK